MSDHCSVPRCRRPIDVVLAYAGRAERPLCHRHADEHDEMIDRVGQRVFDERRAAGITEEAGSVLADGKDVRRDTR